MPINPFFVGYAIGDEKLPYNRKRPPKFIPPKPVQFGFDFGTQLATQAEYDTDIPRQAREFIDKHVVGAEIDQIKAAFKASSDIGGEKMSNQDLNDFEMTREESELPGAAGLSISLLDLATNPVEAIKDTLKQGFTNITDIDEYAQYASERVIQNLLLGSNPLHPESGMIGDKLVEEEDYAFQELAEKKYGDATIQIGRTRLNDMSSLGQNNPLQIASVSPEGFSLGKDYTDPQNPTLRADDGKGNDLYKTVANSAIEFTKYSRGGKRDAKYNSYLKSVRQTLVFELGTWDGELTDEMRDRIRKFNQRDPKNSIDLDAFKEDLRRSRDLFVAKSGVAASMEGLNGLVIPGKVKLGLAGFTSTLEEFAVEGGGTDVGASLNSTLNTVADQIDNGRKEIQKVRNILGNTPSGGTYNRVVKEYEEMLNSLDRLLFDVGANEVSESKFDANGNLVRPNRIKPVSSQVRKLLSKSGIEGGPILDKASATALLNSINSITSGGLNPLGSPLSASTVVHPSLLMKLQRELIEDGLSKSISHQGVVSLYDIGVLTEILGIDEAQPLKVITKRLQNMREWDAFREFVTNFEKGKLINNYYYVKRIRDNMKMLTPNYWVTKALERVQYFGFKIDDDAKAWAKTPGIIRAILRNERLSGVFGHNFSINVKFDKGGPAYRFDLRGGTHFEAVGDLYSLYTAGGLGVTELQDLMSLLSGKSVINPADFERKLRIWEQTFAGIYSKLNNSNPQEAAKELITKLRNLSTWIQGDGRKVLGNHADNAMHLVQFFGSLFTHSKNPGTGDITKRFMGLIDKLAIQFNKLQSIVFKRLKKYIMPLLLLKQAIAEGIADAIYAALGVATAGSSTLLVPLKWVIQWVVVKAIDFFEGLGKAFLKGDFSKIFVGIEKSIKQLFTILLYASIAPIFCFIMVFFIMSTILSSINPINIAKSAYNQVVTAANGLLPGGSSTPWVSSIDGSTLVGADGHYYSQRDSRWASMFMGASKYTVGGYGCLITSAAMMYSYYDLTPITPAGMASNKANFDGALFTWQPYDGHSWIKFSGSPAAVRAKIDERLLTNRPVVLGITANGAATPRHWVLIIGVQDGKYVAHDPWIGPDILLQDHYDFVNSDHFGWAAWLTD